MKRAVFPGSFDPITLGHVDIVRRGLELFDEIIIAIGSNADKKYMFSESDRAARIEKAFEGESRVKVMSYSGLTAHFCRDVEAGFIIRGLRNTNDFNYEQPIAQTNYKMTTVETVLLMSSPEVSNISSSIVRDVLRNNGDASYLIP